MGVTVTKRYRFYDGSRLVDSYSEKEEGLVVGGAWTPSHESHMPNYDSSKYYYYEITYDGNDYTVGSIVCPDTDFTVTYKFYGDPTRPENWEWKSDVRKGAPMSFKQVGDTEYEVYPLTASEWNNFIDHIFYFIEYMEYSVSGDIDSVKVTKGMPMTAEQMNNVYQLIDILHPKVSLPDVATAEEYVTAKFINGLKNSLNSVE